MGEWYCVGSKGTDNKYIATAIKIGRDDSKVLMGFARFEVPYWVFCELFEDLFGRNLDESGVSTPIEVEKLMGDIEEGKILKVHQDGVSGSLPIRTYSQTEASKFDFLVDTAKWGESNEPQVYGLAVGGSFSYSGNDWDMGVPVSPPVAHCT